ncbi:TIGR00730 family Rossman fold protein [Enterococcus sp. DIV0876]|uniref:LOG family protein n=1 Tax=Enterococcus sp. DIV0876 TaxID=2774633 RepID=UPI003D2FF179
MKVTVFCGAQFGKDPQMASIAREIGHYLAKNHIELVYGGSLSGLMGEISEGVIENNGAVTGIYPLGLFADELPRTSGYGTYTSIFTDSMAERKEQLIGLGDGYLVLPGGFGTLEELSQVLSSIAIGLIPSKPIGVLNIDGFYDGLQQVLNAFGEGQFANVQVLESVRFMEDHEALVDYLIDEIGKEQMVG